MYTVYCINRLKYKIFNYLSDREQKCLIKLNVHSQKKTFSELGVQGNFLNLKLFFHLFPNPYICFSYITKTSSIVLNRSGKSGFLIPHLNKKIRTHITAFDS